MTSKIILQRIMNKIWLRNLNLNDARTFTLACIVAPFFFGCVSLWLGADTNWDLANYHLYNAFSLLNGKLSIDLAPAGMQTYFNPVLDVPYYLMSLYFPAPLIGFIMGAVHGINFVLLAGITFKALPNLPAEDRLRVPLLLTVFGCLTANFLSAIGNTMGDDTTSILLLGSLLMILHGWTNLSESGIRSILIVIFAGLLAGLGAGLKLTNVVYALALCVSFCVVQVSWAIRFRIAFLFGIGVLIGMTITGGYWIYEMWRQFGNPLFPQFSAFFPNPLTQSIAVLDVVWRPKNGLETAFWPFLFSLNPKRVGQLGLHQIIWPVVYVLFWYWSAKTLIKNKTTATSSLSPPARYIVAVVAIGYVIWMEFFSIQRYLVPIEVCTPLVVFILLTQLMHYRKARKVAVWILAMTSAIVLLGGLSTWGHASWSEKMFRIDLPPLDVPAKTTAILVGGDPPYGWIAAQFPSEVAFVQVQGNFPEAMPGYGNQINEIVKKRGGPVFAIFQGQKQSSRINQIASFRSTASDLGITSNENGCAVLRWATVNLKLHAVVTILDQPLDKTKCTIDVLPSDVVDVDAKNKAFISIAEKNLAIYGYSINSASCKSYKAYTGKDESAYQWCKLVSTQ